MDLRQPKDMRGLKMCRNQTKELYTGHSSFLDHLVQRFVKQLAKGRPGITRPYNMRSRAATLAWKVKGGGTLAVVKDLRSPSLLGVAPFLT